MNVDEEIEEALKSLTEKEFNLLIYLLKEGDRNVTAQKRKGLVLLREDRREAVQKRKLENKKGSR